MLKGMYLYLVDYTKVFDKVLLKEVLEILRKLVLCEKIFYSSVIFTNKKTPDCMQTENNFSKYTKNTKMYFLTRFI